MDKATIEQKINELEALKKRIDDKRKEVEKELTDFRFQLYSIIQEENKKKKEDEANAPPKDMSFLDTPEWSGFD